MAPAYFPAPGQFVTWIHELCSTTGTVLPAAVEPRQLKAIQLFIVVQPLTS